MAEQCIPRSSRASPKTVRPVSSLQSHALPPQALAGVLQVEGAIRSWRRANGRSAAILALLAGPDGTGKTLVPEVLARNLGMPLYRVDLASIVSKYVGETEKNLRQVFDAAEQFGSIVFFDDADSLFGTRSEVSGNRYRGLEGCLVQALDSARVVAIMAIREFRRLPPALMRRARFSLNFAAPGDRE